MTGDGERRGAVARVVTLGRAEFLKIWASRMPLVFIVSIPLLVYLFVVELYHVEDVTRRTLVRHAGDMLPLLHFATWKALLFQAAVTAFAAYWVTVDCQYGMVRVACAQTAGRAEYLLGKWLGIGAHVAVFGVTLVSAQTGWLIAYSGVRGMTGGDWAAVARFAAEVVAFTLALAGVGMAAAAFRRTVGAGLITALLAFIALGFMTMVPFEVLAPRYVLMRYFFFPLGEFPNPWPGHWDSPFVRTQGVGDFVLIVTLTPACVALAALAHFARRDITE